MNRFEKRNGGLSFLKIALPPLLTLFLILAFAFSMDSISAGTQQQQKKNLEDAVVRNVIQCYIIEGAYPESLDYLESHYPLLYDSSQFKIDYQPIGENLMPVITILDKKQ